MAVCDAIAGFICEMLESEDGCAELRRSELAQRFSCVPSQINYVISTRFSPEHGYIVESRRGGGGYIRIRRARMDARQLLSGTISAIGCEIDQNTARAFLSHLLDAGVVEPSSARLIAAAIGDISLKCLPGVQRDHVRACIFKQMLLNCVNE